MFRQGDEVEKLWNQSNEIKCELKKDNRNNPFRCGACKGQAISPVVSHCGHIYCWKCITERLKHNYCKCSCCKQSLSESSLRPIYISGTDEEESLPRRPKAKNSKPIANSTRISAQPIHNFQLNNVQSGKIVCGLGYFPSTFTLAFVKNRTILQSTFSQPSKNNLSSMQKNITKSINRIQTILIIFVPLVIIIFLLISYII